MQIIEQIGDMQAQSRSWQGAGWRIAFVPTMGNLHEGHLDLVREAARCADRVVVSIFVNPLQFDEAADFERYPRTLEADLRRLVELEVDAVFVPTEEAMYPQGRDTVTRVEVPQLTGELEGACRPGHFTGVATVVTKLFNTVLPDVALFGEKDFQQLLVVRKLVADLNLPLEIRGQPTRREADGLAMSSRNRYLDPADRERAPRLYATLQWVAQQWQQGHRVTGELEEAAIQKLADAGFAPEYVSVRRAADLQPPSADETACVVLGAARLGNVRLIDNLRV